MKPNTAATSDADDECEVMTAIDDQRLIIADICRDGAWLALPLSEALPLEAYR
ncbi:hypothetical protein ACFQPA_10800 [Halomarina halobia]|uniref:Uncharacterized protein n=1 Tax=Halomarina halobia TaxID=3033386 RepID=A0ABD6AA33_9EURY|nr:hypothetical protein [Halomarina sp. PSR21]